MSRSFSKLWTPVASVAAFISAAAPAAEQPVFERDILPILTRNCLGCHGGLRRQGGLDMRTMPLVLEGGESGPAVQPGNVEASELWKRIADDDMPPGDKKLSAEEKTRVRQWIAAGLPTLSTLKLSADPLLDAGKHDPKVVGEAIDRHIAAGLGRPVTAPAADDAEFLRRVFLDLAGRVPTAEQAKAFLDDAGADKRAKLIDDLLASPRFGEQFGRTWREWFCPSELPSIPNQGFQAHAEARTFGRWIGQRIHDNASWATITREIIAVEGEKPPAAWLLVTGENGGASPRSNAQAFASLFLGQQIQCAECHDDPYRPLSQRDHWALAAFFSQTSVSGKTGEQEQALTARERPSRADAQIMIPTASFKNAGTRVMAGLFGGPPSFPDAKEFMLRPVLADWVTAKDNPHFAPAFANRLWFYFFARGLVMPVDDMRDLNPPSHPGLLKLLANEFAAGEFDVKHLVRCICNSAAYQRSSRVPAGADHVAAAAEIAGFGRMPVRVMTADQLYDSISLAYGIETLDLRSVEPNAVSTQGMSASIAKDPLLEFQRCFCINEDDPSDFTHGIPQMLTLISHPRLLQSSPAIEAFRRSNPDTPASRIVEQLHLSTLSRRPTAEEQAEAARFLAGASDEYVGVLWSLVNRSEFSLVR